MDAELPDDARRALDAARARPLSYVVRCLRAPGERERLVFVLGEAHVKLGTAASLGRDVVRQFDLRGVESFPVRRVTFGRVLWLFVHGPRVVLRALTFGGVKGSTITEAKALAHGHTVELESAAEIPVSLHVGAAYLALFFVAFTALVVTRPVDDELLAPLAILVLAMELHLLLLVPAWLLRSRPWAWLLHPFLAIVTTRDDMMARGTVQMLARHPEPRAAVVVMGRAHVSGYVKRLVAEHGFTEAPLPSSTSPAS